MAIADLAHKFITADEVAAREQIAGRHLEIHAGQWEEQITLAGELHNQIILRLTLLLAPFILKHGLGRFYGDNMNFVLQGTPQNILTMRIPDAAFVAQHRLGELQSGYLYLAPDLAIEVLSPTEGPPDTAAKIKDYLQAGTQEIWVIDPEAQTLVVYTPQGLSQTYTLADQLSSPLLPGLRLSVAAIFELS
jgi:Uma2 family endonuclease